MKGSGRNGETAKHWSVMRFLSNSEMRSPRLLPFKAQSRHLLQVLSVHALTWLVPLVCSLFSFSGFFILEFPFITNVITRERCRTGLAHHHIERLSEQPVRVRRDHAEMYVAIVPPTILLNGSSCQVTVQKDRTVSVIASPDRIGDHTESFDRGRSDLQPKKGGGIATVPY
jgi:hypothetical protein